MTAGPVSQQGERRKQIQSGAHFNLLFSSQVGPSSIMIIATSSRCHPQLTAAECLLYARHRSKHITFNPHENQLGDIFQVTALAVKWSVWTPVQVVCVESRLPAILLLPLDCSALSLFYMLVCFPPPISISMHKVSLHETPIFKKIISFKVKKLVVQFIAYAFLLRNLI